MRFDCRTSNEPAGNYEEPLKTTMRLYDSLPKTLRRVIQQADGDYAVGPLYQQYLWETRWGGSIRNLRRRWMRALVARAGTRVHGQSR